MSDKSWLSLSIDGLSGNPAVLSFDLNEASGISLVFDDNAGSLDIEAPDNISFRSGSRLDLYSYVITEIGDIFFTTPTLAEIGIKAGHVVFGQVYLGKIKDFMGENR